VVAVGLVTLSEGARDVGRSDRVSAIWSGGVGARAGGGVTPSAAEVEWARGRTQDPQHLLALVVWLKSYERLGYFPKLDEVPVAVLDQLQRTGAQAGAVVDSATTRLELTSVAKRAPATDSDYGCLLMPVRLTS
jgi:hypothetical protein